MWHPHPLSPKFFPPFVKIPLVQSIRLSNNELKPFSGELPNAFAPGKLLRQFGGECEGPHSPEPNSNEVPPASVCSEEESGGEAPAPRRRQVQRACVNCRRSKTGCSHQRPCKRCVNLGIGDTCVDAPRKRRRERGEEEKSAKKSRKRKAESSVDTGSCKSRKKTLAASPGDDAHNLTLSLLDQANAEPDVSHTLDGLLQEHCLPFMGTISSMEDDSSSCASSPTSSWCSSPLLSPSSGLYDYDLFFLDDHEALSSSSGSDVDADLLDLQVSGKVGS